MPKMANGAIFMARAMIAMQALKMASRTCAIGWSSSLTTVLSAQPKNSAKTISATIAPEKALAAESIGFAGSRSTMYWNHGLADVAVAFFEIVCTSELEARAAASKLRPTPGLKML